MAVSEFHERYLNYLNEKITVELDCNIKASQIWDVVQHTTNLLKLHSISCDEAESVYRTVFELYPEFEKEFRAKLKKMV